MNPGAQSLAARSDPLFARVFAGFFGAFLGLCLLKFGNPPSMEKWVTEPHGFWEFLLNYPWPIAWAYWLLALAALLGLMLARWTPGVPRWLALLPLIWLAWQFLAAWHTVDPRLSNATV